MGRMTREQQKAMFAKLHAGNTAGAGRIKAADREKLFKKYEDSAHGKHWFASRRDWYAHHPEISKQRILGIVKHLDKEHIEFDSYTLNKFVKKEFPTYPAGKRVEIADIIYQEGENSDDWVE